MSKSNNTNTTQDWQYKKCQYTEYECYSDKDMVKLLLARDTHFTEYFLYHKAYPLLKSYYNYFGYGKLIGYISYDDYVHDFYLELMRPRVKNGEKTSCSKLNTFEGRCSLLYWMKVVCYNFCVKRVKQHNYHLPLTTDINGGNSTQDNNHHDNYPYTDNNDIFILEDFDRILSMMPNQKYAFILREIVINQRSEKDLAEQMGEGKYFYVMINRAREQYIMTLQNEEQNYG